MNPWFLHRWAVLVVAVSGVGQVAAMEDDPFARPGAPAAVVPHAPGRFELLELTGVSSLGQAVHVCISERDTRRTRWLTIGSPAQGWLAAEYDPQLQAVRLEAAGVSGWVGMRQAVIATLTLPLRDDGSIDWAHFRKSDSQKAREAEEMMTDLLEVGQAARMGRLGRAEPGR